MSYEEWETNLNRWISWHCCCLYYSPIGYVNIEPTLGCSSSINMKFEAEEECSSWCNNLFSLHPDSYKLVEAVQGKECGYGGPNVPFEIDEGGGDGETPGDPGCFTPYFTPYEPDCISLIASVEKINPRNLEEGDYFNDAYLYRFVEKIAFSNEYNLLKINFPDISCPPSFNLYYINKSYGKQDISYSVISIYPENTGQNIPGYYIISFNPDVEESPFENFKLYVENNNDAGNKLSVNYDYVCRGRGSIDYTITDETSVSDIARQTGLTSEEIESFNIGKTISFARYSTISLPEEIISLSGEIKYESSRVINGKRIFYEDNFCSKRKYVTKVEDVKETYKFSTLTIEQYFPAEEAYADFNTFSAKSKMTAFLIRDFSAYSTNGLAYLLKGEDYLEELPSSVSVSILSYPYETEGDNPSLYSLTSKEIADNCLIEVIDETNPTNANEDYFIESMGGRMNLFMPYEGIDTSNLAIQRVLITGSKEGKSCPISAERISSTYPENFDSALRAWSEGKIRLSKMLDITKRWVKNE